MNRIRSIVFVLSIVLCIFFINNQVDTTVNKDVELGISMLKKEEKKSVADAQTHIDQIEKELEEQNNKNHNNSAKSFKIRYQNSVILGDSIAEAILDYRILPQTNVLAVRGRRTDNSQNEINTAISLSPKYIFLCFGMNDLPYCRGNEKRFIAQYKSMIQQLQNALPNAKIYVNSIVPMTEKGYQNNKYNKNDKKFNDAMKKMCIDLKIMYLDNDSLIHGNLFDYESDGIHPKYNFYPKWLQFMAESAGI